MFIRRGAPGPLLSPLYDGPYHMLTWPKVLHSGVRRLARAHVGGPSQAMCLATEVVPAVSHLLYVAGPSSLLQDNLGPQPPCGGQRMCQLQRGEIRK